MRSKEPREIVHESLSLANAELIEEASSTTRMSDVDTSRQEAAETVSDAPIDVDDLPSDAEASTSAGPAKPAGPGRPKGKSTTTTASNNGKDAEQGLDSFLLPRSTVTKIAKSAVPPNTKLQKEVPTALTRGAVVFISYLTSLAQEQAAAAGVKTIKPEHVLDALPELDWGEADTARLRKDLKKQLKAFRRNAKAKKEGKPLPGPSTGRRGRPPRALATDNETTVVEDDEDGTNEAQDAMVPEVEIQYKSNGLLKKAASADEESSDEEDDVNVRRIADDKDGDDEGAESPIEDDDIEEDEEEEDEEQEEEDDIDDADDADPRDFEDEMGQGLDDKRLHEGNEDMDD